MSRIQNNYASYTTRTAYDNDTDKDYPNVSYVIADDEIIWAAAPTPKYLTFEAVSAGTLTIQSSDSSANKTISYSTDNGATWTSLTTNTTAKTIKTLSVGDKVLVKGTNSAYGLSTTAYNKFGGTAFVNVSGNIMSLIGGDNFDNLTTLTDPYTFEFLFTDVYVISAENLILPATTLTERCYYNMFSVCTRLTSAPALPATTLASRCYGNMFWGCASLRTPPALPATTLASYCYSYMFSGCTNLTTAPTLPATTIATNCYEYMFQNCYNVTTAPTLPATTLAQYCYRYMFQNCTSLTTAPALPATTLAQTCYKGMFKGCTSLTTAPALTVTTLANSCYSEMFDSCISLTTAPVLPATTLVSNCYQYMFRDCSSLNYIKAMFTTTPGTSYTNNWVNGVASSGTFVKNSTAWWTTTGNNGIPSGWTVETASE